MTKTPVEAIFALEERVERCEKELAAYKGQMVTAYYADSITLTDGHGNAFPVTLVGGT